jgi:hypothetical protein
MKGKQAILRYLETHRTFTAKDVATECGMTINCITKNAIDLERARKIVRVSKVWRTVTYRLATPEEQAGTARSCTNGIFQECRNSPAMKGIDGLGEGRGMKQKFISGLPRTTTAARQRWKTTEALSTR